MDVYGYPTENINHGENFWTISLEFLISTSSRYVFVTKHNQSCKSYLVKTWEQITYTQDCKHVVSSQLQKSDNLTKVPSLCQVITLNKESLKIKKRLSSDTISVVLQSPVYVQRKTPFIILDTVIKNMKTTKRSQVSHQSRIYFWLQPTCPTWTWVSSMEWE